ncbi:hypothetical protein Avbf_18951 [Armadillidium vulgare]|nr:hypothetical protein Avbf_18951 [Armadillidium vulgare]
MAKAILSVFIGIILWFLIFILSAINVVRLIEIVLAGVIVGVYYELGQTLQQWINRPDSHCWRQFWTVCNIGGLISATIMLIVNIIFDWKKSLVFWYQEFEIHKNISNTLSENIDYRT